MVSAGGTAGAAPTPAPPYGEAPAAGLTARVDGTDAVSRALHGLTSEGIEVETFALGQPSLDEVFLALTGRPAEAVPEPGAAVDAERTPVTEGEPR